MNWWATVLVTAGALAVAGRGGSRLPTLSAGAWWPRLRASVAARPRPALMYAVGVMSAVALLAGGPVAATVSAAYGGFAGRALTRHSARRRASAARAAALDALAALAADLRAGLPPADLSAGLPSVEVGGGAERLTRLAAAVWRLAEQTGAPVADLVERIEADGRTADRAAASASAQAAGAQATAMLLAALPFGGLALGVLIGADPLYVLLHTPLGGTCAVVAVALQCAGLLWAERLTGR
ncbi:hypothetical protein [Actinoplanes sp. NPDC048796]|uniref:type II secretion system F family protein n=1 Tax=Actinoplanes sp. NPDC048796 TaxID=3155640 RepID=UPI0033FFBBB9